MKKNILILGGSGFIGKNLSIFFSKKKDFKVTATYFKNKPKIKGVKLVYCDLTKQNQTEKVVKGADIIIQAAATTSGAKDIIERPYIHVNDNSIINSMVTRAAFNQKVKHVLVFSCTVMYRSSNKSQKEADLDLNKEIYPNYFGGAWMKIFVEKLCEFYSRLGVNKYTLIRHSNVYGPHDKFDLDKSHVFAASLNKVVNNKSGLVHIWGDGNESRDLLYIEDLLKFVDLAIKKQKSRYELFNVGRGKLISINNLVEKIIRIHGVNLKIKNDLSKKSLKNNVKLNCNKAKTKLGWVSKVSIEKGIEKTLKWYLKNYKN